MTTEALVLSEPINPPADLAMLEATEAALGSRVPDGYRTFLLTVANGGYVEWMTGNPESHIDLQELYSAKASFDVEHDWGGYFRTQIHPGFLPIGSTGTGDQLCISIRDQDIGAIWAWHHDNADREDQPTTDCIFRIAPSWDEFFSGQYPNPDAYWQY